MMQPAVVGGDVDPQRGPRRDEKLPGEGGGLLRERAVTRCPKFVHPQENAIGRAQAEVGKIGSLQPDGDLPFPQLHQAPVRLGYGIGIRRARS